MMMGIMMAPCIDYESDDSDDMSILALDLYVKGTRVA